MAHSLVKGDPSGALSDDLLFVRLESKVTEGLGMSLELRKTSERQ